MAAVFLIAEMVAPGIHLLPALGLAIASGLFFASLLPLKGRNLRRTPLPVWGMVIAHLALRSPCSAWPATAPSPPRSSPR
jgi:cytochrome c-type biogenesis protein CcmF